MAQTPEFLEYPKAIDSGSSGPSIIVYNAEQEAAARVKLGLPAVVAAATLAPPVPTAPTVDPRDATIAQLQAQVAAQIAAAVAASVNITSLTAALATAKAELAAIQTAVAGASVPSVSIPVQP